MAVALNLMSEVRHGTPIDCCCAAPLVWRRRLGIFTLAQVALNVCMNTFEGKHGSARLRPGILIKEQR